MLADADSSGVRVRQFYAVVACRYAHSNVTYIILHTSSYIYLLIVGPAPLKPELRLLPERQ